VVFNGIELDALRDGLVAAVARNESLRTTFQRLPAMRLPAQAVHDALAPAWRIADDAVGDPEGIAALLASEAAEPFDLESGPVLRVLAAKLPEGRALLVLTAPAACADPRSLLLAARQAVSPLSGEAEPVQYADYAAWRHESSTDDGQTAAAVLDGRAAPEAPLPLQQTGASDSFASTQVPVAPTLVEPLEAVAAAVGSDLETVLHASWLAFLCRVAAVDDVAAAVLTSGRAHAELLDAVGAYDQALPVAVHVEPATTFAEVVDQVRRSRADAERAAELVPAQILEAAAGIATSIGVVSTGDLDVRLLTVPRGSPSVAVTWTVGRAGLAGRIEHDTATLEPAAAAGIARSLAIFVEGVAAGGTATLAELPVVSPSDEEQLADLEAGETAELPQVCLHHLVEETAARIPDAPAVRTQDESLSYRELDERANRLAHRLHRVGVDVGATVAVCMTRSIGSIVAVLATMKAGGAYVPLNFEHPPARLLNQLEQAGVKAVLTEEALLDRLPEVALPVIALDRDAAELATEPGTSPDVALTPNDLAYVLYTSGSTGQPKGVEIRHRNLVNYTTHLLRVLGGAEGRTFGVVSALSTDLGNTCLFPSLAGGGCLVLVDPDSAMDPKRFAESQHERPIDVLKITPSHLRALLAGEDDVLPRQVLVLGGEALSWELLDRVSVDGLRVLNHYGPTETTIGSCIFDPAASASATRSAATVPVGRPIANTRVHVLDPLRRRVPLGTPGELCITGAGVGRGYVAAPELTDAVFVPDAFGPEPGARMYRTGDRVRMLADGSIEFLGRIDHQVKIRGYRVEPGEIEAVLSEHAGVRQSAVVARGEADDRRLYAYVVPSGSPSSAELRSYLGDLLPEYMIPSAFVMLDTLPLTPSGKVDRLALPDPEGASDQAYVAPRNAIEETIADAWASVLGVERVGVDDNFFALGGHSLMATQVIARLRTTFGVDLPLHALFTSPTVAGLAVTVADLGGGVDGDVAAIMAELEGLSEDEVGALLADGEERKPA
jgi:amino acid adenylation domain-containing protein